MKQNNPINLSNIVIINRNKQFFEMKLEISTIIQTLITWIIYNWQSIEVIHGLAFFIVLKI